MSQIQGMNSENIKNGRDSKGTPRSEQNLSYLTPPRSTGWYLSPLPGWKPPTYTDALADPERYPRVDPHNYFTHRSSDYTSVYALGSEESGLTSKNNIEEENYLLNKLQTLYNKREYVLSLKADHPLINKTHKTIQEIKPRLNDLYEDRFPKNELESITDPIGLQKERFRRRERRAKRAQGEEQINPNQMARNHEHREDYRQDEIDRQNKAK